MTNETITSVLKGACCIEPELMTTTENTSQDERSWDNRISVGNTDEIVNEESDGLTDLEVSDLARAYWIQLHKLKKQLIEHAFLESLRNLLVNDERMDVDTELSWELFLRDIKIFMGEGIAIQRNTYLRECMTSAEILDIRSKWEKIVKFGLQEAGEILCETAITAFEVTINSHSDIVGFCDLPASVKEFVVSCMALEICPTFARKAMMEGLFAMLSKVFGEAEMSESLSRTWSKVYRALEQAVIINIVEY
ncbi:unnamed protein product [Angiostrongylus costaricensis]|uniref:GLOBIN domain-containing protein n=1 Tax=Angiostrongylus costaricensis TaxID=334426 RepID=A0A0R3PLF8_ANGCS|nr:unnamed protein product [Angiostrongylus costaricensis]